MAKILVVDDDAEFAKTVSKWLELERHDVVAVHEPNDALEKLRLFQFDLLLVDWNMPQMTGIELCRRYRALGGPAKIMMLTCMDRSENKVSGLEAGADDYLSKPFDMNEMLARVRALLRRPNSYQPEVLKVGNITVNTTSHVVDKDGAEIHLKPQEFCVLEFFLRNPGKVFSPEMFIYQLWGAADVSNDSVYTCIKGIRQKLDDSQVIKTVHGLGYRHDPPAAG